MSNTEQLFHQTDKNSHRKFSQYSQENTCVGA